MDDATRKNLAKEIGSRIQQAREKKGLTQAELASKLFKHRSLIGHWETGERNNYTQVDLEKICKELNIDPVWLLTGIDPENLTVNDDLGLSNWAVNQLKDWKEHDIMLSNHTAVIDIEDTSGTAETVNFSPAEILPVINTLITSLNGQRLLSLIYRYLFTDFSHATSINGQEDNLPEFGVRSIGFENNCHGVSGKTQFDSSLLKFATLRAVENCLDDLRKEQDTSGSTLAVKETKRQDPFKYIPRNIRDALYQTDYDVYSFLTNENNQEHTKIFKKDLKEISALTEKMVGLDTEGSKSALQSRKARDQALDDLVEKVRQYMQEQNQSR